MRSRPSSALAAPLRLAAAARAATQPDVGLGWPLRYALSPTDVIGLRGLVALAGVIQLTAERW